MVLDSVSILSAGEQGLVVEFGDSINAEVNFRVHKLAQKLVSLKDNRIIEVIPTYRSLLIYFDPIRISRDELSKMVHAHLTQQTNQADQTDVKKVVYVPVCYGGEYGPDIEYVAGHNKLTVPEVIEIHTSAPYLVYMLGFTPGFPYLGGMSEKIATSRLEKPRTRIPAGSVGIAGSQTGFYPIESPGGWQLIGRTPVKAFNPKSENPFLFAAGDYLRFQAITIKEYELICRDVEEDRFTPKSELIGMAGELK